MTRSSVRIAIGAAAIAAILLGAATARAADPVCASGVGTLSRTPPLDRSEEPSAAPACATETPVRAERHAARIEQSGTGDAPESATVVAK